MKNVLNVKICKMKSIKEEEYKKAVGMPELNKSEKNDLLTKLRNVVERPVKKTTYEFGNEDIYHPTKNHNDIEIGPGGNTAQIGINENNSKEEIIGYHGTWWGKKPHELHKSFHLGNFKAAIDRLAQEYKEENFPSNPIPHIYRYKIITEPESEIYADPYAQGEETYKIGNKPIKYENEIEDPGSISYIVKPKHVKFVDEIESKDVVEKRIKEKIGINETLRKVIREIIWNKYNK